MATQKQVFTEITESIDRCNHTLPGLIQFLKNGFQKLENASGGGGGGSTVEWKQIQASGTKIAEIEIDGDKTSVYAPTGASGSVSVTTDGVKPRSQIFDDLFALIDSSKITGKSFMSADSAAGSSIFPISYISESAYVFTQIGLGASDIVGASANVKASGSTYYASTGTTVTDGSSYVMPTGVSFTIHY